jgi:hypothetical protein
VFFNSDMQDWNGPHGKSIRTAIRAIIPEPPCPEMN